MSFKDLKISPDLIKQLSAADINKPFPIQKATLPDAISGKDILGRGQTGSGKTASYVLPILTNSLGYKGPRNRHIQTLVLVPTRELAVQVTQVFQAGDIPRA